MKLRWIGAFRNDSMAYLPAATAITTTQMSWAEQYAVLDAYAANTGLYEFLAVAMGQHGYTEEAIKGLRNPTSAVIEFYAAKLWAGRNSEVFKAEVKDPNTKKAAPVSPALQKAIDDIFIESNWQTQKQAVSRTFPTHGDLFLKVSTKLKTTFVSLGSDSVPVNQIEKVNIEQLPVKSVTKIKVDNRGYLTYVRLDTPITEEQDDGTEKAFLITEEYDKERQLYRQWKHDKTSSTPIKRLTGLIEENSFQDKWRHDFIPIVWQPFRNNGGERGQSVIASSIDNIDEVNRMATQLHSNIFRYNEPLIIIGRDGTDASGRPLPPVKLGDDTNSLSMSSNPDQKKYMMLPGATFVDSLIPKIDYGAHLQAIRDMYDNIVRDLPELVYAMLHTIGGNPSSLSLQTLLLAASDRLMEARQNAETALIRALQMAISIGQAGGLFAGAGDYKNGTLDFTFAERPVWTRSELEIAQTMQAYSNAGVPTSIAAKRAGWSETEVAELDTALEQERQQQEELNNNKANQVLAQLRSQPSRNGASNN